MAENKNEVLLSLVSDLSRRRKRIMKREMGLAQRPERAPGAPHEHKLFPPDILSQRGRGGAEGHRNGPPMARLRILSALLEMDAVSQSRLAVILSIRPQSLTELLGKMESEGLITRRQNDADRRQNKCDNRKSNHCSSSPFFKNRASTSCGIPYCISRCFSASDMIFGFSKCPSMTI